MVGNSGSKNTSTKTITSIQGNHSKENSFPDKSLNQQLGYFGHAQKKMRPSQEEKNFAGTRDESPYGRQPQRRINPAHKISRRHHIQYKRIAAGAGSRNSNVANSSSDEKRKHAILPSYAEGYVHTINFGQSRNSLGQKLRTAVKDAVVEHVIGSGYGQHESDLDCLCLGYLGYRRCSSKMVECQYTKDIPEAL
ncbi:hypothetical protein GHT06_012003 [Daphnia sinensis]|uniref:Uncharacterized protein n=1 Tax=Daphnia sinensis TaxID=1820382 RepID=A0AAD5PVR8_9CRUS|nr:hypothetical protein GHT06_012003 [Daphnia sinensis]